MIERRAYVHGERRLAIYSDCEMYRYALRIEWIPGRGLVRFIGLNPSTATELVDDPTLRRCKRFAGEWGYGGIIMTNLAAFRATDPKAMFAQDDPIGPYNQPMPDYLRGLDVRLVVACWGSHAKHPKLSEHAERFKREIPALHCLSRCANGEPGHPLYLKASSKPVPLACEDR